MNRRDFLKRMGGVAAAITLSPLLDLCPIEPVVEYAINTTGTYGAINRATFTFWRNVQIPYKDMSEVSHVLYSDGSLDTPETL